MSEFALINWINKRTFAAAMFTQSIFVNLTKTVTGFSHQDVAEALTDILGRTYTDVDVRLMLGQPNGEEEQQALQQVGDYLKDFGGEKALEADIDETARRLIKEGKDPHWVGYVAEYLRQALNYRKDCEALLIKYNAAVESLPELAERTDLTKVVAYPEKAEQSTEVNDFIDSLVAHFRIMDNVFLVAPTEVWPLSSQIVVRTLETDSGPIVTVPTSRGVIVVNATPE